MKPTITKEQAEAIESCAMNCGDTYKERLIRGHADDSGDWSGEYASLNDLDLLTLAAALVNGYEVEKTPEEKVREYHRSLVCDMDRALSYEEEGNYRSAIEAVEETLKLFGIKIEGVNA
ncbi:hypothetical protein [Bacillus inaquosorum]|uniref:hypothetical protein n=1 Tax=Bacillus inaquosorum TaxID=483913 RepID=UPI002282BCD7|nr:hypothetical protein [Bacillus inaquosorum]MCY7759718.1 hypothetical protein [Bacillus inaquosorum]MCY8731576.1 hypothetical protein [Bacillus inaquosorum]